MAVASFKKDSEREIAVHNGQRGEVKEESLGPRDIFIREVEYLVGGQYHVETDGVKGFAEVYEHVQKSDRVKISNGGENVVDGISDDIGIILKKY